MKPGAVAQTERLLEVAAARWTPVTSRGHALGDRWLVGLADGRTVFAKRAIDEPTADWLRAEHVVYRALAAPFLPQLLGWEDGMLPLLLLEDLSGAAWPPPWSRDSVDAVLQALDELAATRPPDGLARLADSAPT
ncbi:MAG: hypothetical protein ABIR67_12605, partial [Gaiellaceae bacterium]